jgi:Reverse transcriptase (RNA-dependent DNA polymerase)
MPLVTQTDTQSKLKNRPQPPKPVPRQLKKKIQTLINVEKLHILHLNVRGLKTSTKYTLFIQFIAQVEPKPDVIFLNEHWLDKYEVKSFFVKDYFLVSSFGRGKKAQGGSLILVKDFLKPYVKDIKIRSVESKFEICGAALDINNTKLTLVSLYRPNNRVANRDINGFFDNLEDFLEKHRGTNDIILAGDLNIDILKDEPNTRHLIDIFETYNMKLLNGGKITRANNNNVNGGSLIDHIFTSIVQETTYDIIDYECSDHKAIISSLNLPISRPKDRFKLTRKFSDKNWQTFIDFLIKENWQTVYDVVDVDEKSNIFMTKITEYFELAFPLKKIVIRANQTNKTNLSAGTRMLRNRLLNIDCELRSSLSEIEKHRLRAERARLRKQVSSGIRYEVKVNNDQKIQNSTNKSSTAWKIFKETIGKMKFQHDINSLNVNGKKEIIKFNIANNLNQAFLVPLPSEPNISDDYNFTPPPLNVPFVLCPTDEAEIYAVICKLAPKKSSGWDDISVQTLKRISLFILKPLSHLINCSFSDGKFPKNMKVAKIIPLYKKGDKEDASNYRPIAITSSFSKVYEKIFLSRLEYHFEKNNIINPEQHGFQRGKSTVTALFDFAQQVFNSMEAREKLNVILYDFSNAFGTLYPQLLLRKLRIYGLTDEAISWLLSFLVHREQYVQIRDVDCDGTEITINSERLISDMGVPQGTILGPTSFITYSNDLSLKILIAILILFADDSTVLIKGKTLHEANTNTIKTNNDFVQYADENLLKINASKTKVMQIHTHQSRNVTHPHLEIHGTHIEAVDNCKLLGVLISDTMNWFPQCESVANKLRSVTYLFTILRDIVSESALKTIYYAYAQSQILYSIVIWGASPHLKKVFIAQKRVLRAMAGLRYWRSNCALDTCRPLFKKYEILTVFSLYILECMKFLTKHPEKFRRKTDVTNCISPKTKAAKRKQCISDIYVEIEDHLDILNQNPIVMIARIFNALPINIKLIEEPKQFLCKIREIVYKYQFYDMNEFFICEFNRL